MTGSGFSDALRRVLAGVPDRIPIATIDRIWLFPARDLGGRESGLLVLSLFAGDPEVPALRELVTLQYETSASTNDTRIAETLISQGHAPAELIPRLIEGVLARMKDDREELTEQAIGGVPDHWAALLDRASVAGG